MLITNVLYDRPSMTVYRGGSRNSSRGGGGSGPEFFEGGGRVQVHGNFHILTSKQKKPRGGGVNPLSPPGSATGLDDLFKSSS